jgi:mannan endo-1,4-beta-mannosidase
MNLKLLLSIPLLILSMGTAKSQVFEAESGVMTPDPSTTNSPALVVACATCSNGSAVDTKNTGFTVTIDVAKAGKYNIYMYAASPFGPKTNTFKLDDLSADFTLVENAAYIKVKVLTNIKLTQGVHTLSIIRSWGYIMVDKFELEEMAAPAPSLKLEAEDGTLTSVAANGAVVESCATCSGGSGVHTKESGFSIDAQITKTANYNIYIMVSSADGPKTNTFTVDKGTANALSVDFSTTEVGYVKLKVVSNQKLTAGAHTFEISKSWGWIHVDFIEMEEAAVVPLSNITKTLATPNPTAEATCLYNFLLDNYGKKIISGVMTLKPFDETNALKALSGKEPVIMGMDFMHNNNGYSWYNEQENLNTAKVWTAKNGVVVLTWHWRDPLRKTNSFYKLNTTDHKDGTDFDVSKVNDTNSPEYIAMVKDIDSISARLKEFQNNNIPVLWRPLHEAAGGWFWWGAKSGSDLKQLWKVMYERMVTRNGLKNLIWVWTNNGNDADWYPGDQYVDIVGVDVYNVNGDHGSQIIKFNALNEQYAGKKMLALTEVEASPDVDKLVNDEAAWSWYMPWYGDYAHKDTVAYTPTALLKKNYASDYVLTLDEIPSKSTMCTPTALADENVNKASVQVFPTFVGEYFKITSTETINTVSIYDMQGLLIQNIVGKTNEMEIGFEKQKPGLYFVTINKSKTVKIIKE